jgi:tripartite-type tricarboxylate transporter receptor subunit TctC
MKTLNLSYVIVLFASAVTLALPAHLSAQSYPAKPVRVVVSFPAGGGTDIQARVLFKEINEQFRQVFIVDNRPGASGLIGAELVVNSPADGYTLLFTTAVLATSATFYRNTMKFQPEKDLVPIVQVSSTPLVLIVHPSVPAKSAKELIELARKKPITFNAAINVPGSTSHLSAEMFKQLAGVNVTTVPYKGGNFSIVAVIGGEVDMQFAEGLLAAPQIKAAKVRALAVTTPKPVAFFPDLPTMNSILPGFVSDNWFAMYFPAGTPGEIVATINAAIRKALETKDVRALFERDALIAVGGTPEELGAHLKNEIARYAEVIRKGNITLQ